MIGIGSTAGSSVHADFQNDTTGPSSDNENRLSVDSNSSIDVQNSADIQNTLDVTADTGHNDISNNTIVHNVRTGDVRVDLHAVNRAN